MLFPLRRLLPLRQGLSAENLRVSHLRPTSLFIVFKRFKTRFPNKWINWLIPQFCWTVVVVLISTARWFSMMGRQTNLFLIQFKRVDGGTKCWSVSPKPVGREQRVRCPPMDSFAQHQHLHHSLLWPITRGRWSELICCCLVVRVDFRLSISAGSPGLKCPVCLIASGCFSALSSSSPSLPSSSSITATI